MADQIDLIVADLDQYTRGEIIALALNVNANLRSNPPLGTPIDTGWASANWLPSVGEPNIVSGEPSHPKEGPTPAEVAARAQMASAGENDVLSWRLEDGPIFSTNNVPYIGALDAGHSPQSPRGFVQEAIEKAIRQTYSRAGAQASRNARASAYRSATSKPPRRPGK
jgi:hypothetical protein